MTTNPTPTQAPQKIDAQIGAWIYPDSPGKPACSAPKEYADGRQIDVLKPEYFHLEDTGVLTQRTADAQCNGYSQENAADIKSHSKEQYVTISGGIAGIISLATNTGKQSDFTNTLIGFLNNTGFTGIELDIEGYAGWSHAQYATYLTVVTSFGNALHDAGKKLAVDGPVIFNTKYQSYYPWRWEDFETVKQVDALVVLCYDLQNDNSAGTPVAPLDTIKACCSWMKSKISDPSRIVIGLPNYGYVGQVGSYTPQKSTYQEAQKYPGISSQAKRDPASGEMIWTIGNTVYDYSDTTTMNMRVQAVLESGLKNISIWSLGGIGCWPNGAAQPTPPTPPPTNPPKPLTQGDVIAILQATYPGWQSWYSQHFDAEGNYLGSL